MSSNLKKKLKNALYNLINTLILKTTLEQEKSKKYKTSMQHWHKMSMQNDDLPNFKRAIFVNFLYPKPQNEQKLFF
jgi:hypothetical protein